MNDFEQYIQYRALAFKFGNGSYMTPDKLQDLIDSGALKGANGEQLTLVDQVWPEELKNLCAKVPVSLIDRIEEVISPLNISKREFVQIAVIEALNRIESICEEVNMFEFLDRDAAEVKS